MTEFESKLIYLLTEIAVNKAVDCACQNDYMEDYDSLERYARYRLDKEMKNLAWDGKCPDSQSQGTDIS